MSNLSSSWGMLYSINLTFTQRAFINSEPSRFAPILYFRHWSIARLDEHPPIDGIAVAYFNYCECQFSQ